MRHIERSFYRGFLLLGVYFISFIPYLRDFLLDNVFSNFSVKLVGSGEALDVAEDSEPGVSENS